MALIPSIFKADHPVNTWLKPGAPLLVAILLPLVIFFQQFLLSLSSATLSTGLESMTAVEEPEDPGVASLTVSAKLLIKVRHASVDALARRGFEAEPPTDDELDHLDEQAINRVDKLRVAMVAGELFGPEAALTRLDALSAVADPSGPVAADIDWLRRWYTENIPAADGSLPASTVTPEAIDALIDRHGWFAQLAFSLGKHESDPLRWSAVSGGERFLAFSVLWLVLLGTLALAGIIVLIVWFPRLQRGALVFQADPPSAPAQVYYETFAVFCLIFLFGDMFSVAVLGETSSLALMLSQVLIWACALAMLWPRLRGVPRMEFADDLGISPGEGFSREVIIGFGAFVASRPALSLTSFLISTLSELFGDATEQVGVPMYEQPLSHSWVLVVLGALVSVIWAPFVEEALFRGTLLAALREKVGPAAAIGVSSLAFGAIHPYPVSGLIYVTVMGLILGLLRHWRGSLIAPITLHLLHNAQIECATLGTILLID